MAGPCLDLERLGAGNGEPRDSGSAEIVERQVLPRRVIREEVGSGHAGPSEVAAETPGEFFAWGHRHEAAVPGRLLAHLKEKWH